MKLQDLLNDIPSIHSTGAELVSSFRLGDDMLRFLDRRLNSTLKTLETGAGVSTILFAIKETRHRCITPDHGQMQRIVDYCNRRAISLEKVDFEIDRSEHVLPKMEDGNYDLALIDGRHGFPTPFIDWYYMSNMLKIGGILIVDDLHIWSCHLLFKFLLSEEEWELVQESSRAGVFIKRKNGTHNKEWTHQPFLLERSRATSRLAKMRYGLELLARGKLSLFVSNVKARAKID